MKVYLSLGSNVGDRESNIRLGLERLSAIGTVSRVSSLHENPAHVLPGAAAQPDFLNAAAELHTDLPAEELLDRIKDIERGAGRDLSAPRWSPRPLDIDILLYGSTRTATARLTIPHPHLADRPFVLGPLAEIAPEAEVPSTGKSVRALWAEIRGEKAHAARG